MNFVTNISPSCNLSISANDSITRAVPVTTPLFAPNPFRLELPFVVLGIPPISFSLVKLRYEL